MESIISDDTLSFLESSNKLNSYQHGFTHKRSCLTNLIESLEAWTQALDDGYGVDVIFLDYWKAFDSIPHKRLQEKLKLFGLNAKLVAWITEFLKNRRMRVRVHRSFSNWAEVFSGVPQGSVLGPLLFLLFVNDLPSVIKSHIRMFADDMKIWCTIKQDIDSIGLQQDLDSMDSWCQEWLLKLNPDKCKVMHIGHKMKTDYYVTEEGQLDETTEEKDQLGIYVTDDLKVSLQCAKAAFKAASVLRMIKRNFHRIDVKDFRILYKTYVRPHMEYAIQAWSPHMVKDIQILEKVQQRATKCVYGIKNKTYQQRLKIPGIPSLELRRKRDLIETYKILTGKEGVDRNQLFQLSPNIHSTRGHHLKLFKKPCRINVRKFFFSQRVVDVWNSLPSSVVESLSVNTFKNRLDDYISRNGRL